AAPTQTVSHNIRITDAGPYDPTDVRLVVTRFFNDGTQTSSLVDATGVDMETIGVTLPFEAGAKYQLSVTLPSYGALQGTVPTRDSRTGTPAICTDLVTPAIQAEITAIPVRLVPGDGITTFAHWVDDTSVARPAITDVMTCGDFTVAGKSGSYALAVDHDEFVSDRTAAQLQSDLASGGILAGSTDGVITIPVSGGPSDPIGTIGYVPGLTIRGTPVDLRVYEALGGAAVTGIYYVIRDSADVVVTTNPPAVQQLAIDRTLDPDDYTIEFRGCTTDPSTVTQFEACDLRFPVTVSITVDRTTDPPPTILVEAPLVQVGAEIATTMQFENSRNRPVCLAGTYEATRGYDGQFVGRVDGTDQTLTVDPAVRAESLSFVVPAEAANATSQANCLAAIANGDLTKSFDTYIPTGTHTLTVPVVAGYSAPTLMWDPDPSDATGPTAISGTAVGSTHVEFDVTVTRIGIATAQFRYQATPRAVTLDICGQGNNGSIDCSEEFPGLLVNLIQPNGGDTVGGAVSARLTSGTYNGAYPVTFGTIVPDAEPHSLVVADELHAGAAPASVLVPPGTSTLDFPTPFTFAGTSVRLAFRVEALNSAAGTPVALGSASITVEGRTGNNAWTALSAGTACSVVVDGAAESYTCFTDNSYKDYRVSVTATGYTPKTVQYDNVKKGATLTETITLIKQATLTV
ncbi:MAG: hypothetical protein KDB37_19930, partial [Ilumatobacter sp.]|nr:hypothetical protein [Ilumatobacter sp.]